jgi:hypothetical protein
MEVFLFGSGVRNFLASKSGPKSSRTENVSAVAALALAAHARNRVRIEAYFI